VPVFGRLRIQSTANKLDFFLGTHFAFTHALSVQEPVNEPVSSGKR
jgi:hypothetical protein